MRYLYAKPEGTLLTIFTLFTVVQISTYFDTKCARLLYRICCSYKPISTYSYRKMCGCLFYNFNYAK